jgi:hypothetical protein
MGWLLPMPRRGGQDHGRSCIRRYRSGVTHAGNRRTIVCPQWMHFCNAGTVEYLYNEVSSKFYFLELNPRLQVDHLVTEMIAKVILPAAQFHVAMGIPLDNIPEIRSLYNRNRFEDDHKATASRLILPSSKGHRRKNLKSMWRHISS